MKYLMRSIVFAQRTLALVLPLVLGAATPIRAAVGVFAEGDGDESAVVVFDADRDRVLGSVRLGPSTSTGPAGCSISADQDLAFVTDFGARVWVIEPKQLRLAPGPNPIAISNDGLDTAISRDDRFLLVCGGNTPFVSPISVIDIGARTEVSTLSLSSSCLSIEVCGDGSVLATTPSSLHRLSISDTGTLSDTGEVRSGQFFAQNVTCAPDDASAILIKREDPAEIAAFRIPGLDPADTRVLTSQGSSGNTVLVSPDGDRAYASTSFGLLDIFDYDPESSTLSSLPIRSIDSGRGASSSVFGIDTMALTADGKKLYITKTPLWLSRSSGTIPSGRSTINDDATGDRLRIGSSDFAASLAGVKIIEPARVQVFDAANGTLKASMKRRGFVFPAGICLPRREAVAIDIRPGSKRNRIDPKSRGMVSVALLGSDALDVADVDAATLGFGPSHTRPADEVYFDDVNDDGLTDLVSRYRIQDTGIQSSDTEACVAATLFGGTEIEACDSITTVGRN
jgi:DNA-binding beta-propeller fold protein YncE